MPAEVKAEIENKLAEVRARAQGEDTAEISEGRHGTFFGVLRSAQGVSFILGPAIGGALSLISLRAPFLADAALSLVACGLLLRLVPARAARPSQGASLCAQLPFEP